MENRIDGDGIFSLSSTSSDFFAKGNSNRRILSVAEKTRRAKARARRLLTQAIYQGPPRERTRFAVGTEQTLLPPGSTRFNLKTPFKPERILLYWPETSEPISLAGYSMAKRIAFKLTASHRTVIPISSLTRPGVPEKRVVPTREKPAEGKKAIPKWESARLLGLFLLYGCGRHTVREKNKSTTGVCSGVNNWRTWAGI
ncbi:unnamed protein product [Nesidiocoris tenuis]|uniref:Uncharacterized protein n=1 Tax=Nesidiocoris tenuis TaxID=355587 RepID=A0A6H5H8T8_9HEMI|nr:unnamed protein product [Nesidiocoris tenuis]